jgi:hypothetical protein
MTFRTAALAVAITSLALLGATSTCTTAQAQAAPDSQWRTTQLTLATLLQDGYKIVAVVNEPHSTSGPADTIFVQRDQSAFKCIDPQQSDTKAKATVAPPACFELVPPSGSGAATDTK